MRPLLSVAAAALLVLGLAAPVAAQELPPAQPEGACAAGTRTISGSLGGTNGRRVNASVALVLKNAFGVNIGMDGCGPISGYAQQDQVNSSIAVEGVPGGADTWSFTGVPANATEFWIEVYPRQPSSDPGGRITNRTYFGGVLLRNQALNGNRTGIVLREPATCGHGGNTGGVTAHAFVNGQPRDIDRVGAWAGNNQSPPNNIFGWGVDSPIPNVPVHTIASLAASQTYTVQVRVPGAPGEDQRTFHNIRVNPCANTDLWVTWGSTRFSDVPVWSTFYEEIEWMAVEDITTGYPGGRYKPSSTVTRAAMSAFMYRLAGEPPFDDPVSPSFSDVSLGHTFFHEIEWMNFEGITTGYEGGTIFKPNGHVTREAMSAFMYRLAGEPLFDDPVSPSFSDVALDHTFFHEIEWMNDEGITTGYTNGTYRPGIGVTRAAMSAFMYRLDPLLP